MKIFISFISSIILLLSLSSFAQESPLWLRYPAISPNGEMILFNYQGDIYKVPAKGGSAMPLTLSNSYEYSAVWSHDGNQVAFASDRYGNFDVFVMPFEGGEATRLTYHSNSEKPSDFSRDNKNVIFSTNRQDLYTNVQFPSAVMAELYSVPVSSGRVNQITTSPAHDATYSPDGKKIIYHDRKGYENEWRKHHTSAVTRDIWVYDTETKEYAQLSSWEGENRSPVFDTNGEDFYYLSEESGSFNVHKSSLSNPGSTTQITEFKYHPVRFLTKADDGTLCFSYHGEIYIMSTSGQPEKVSISLGFDGRHTLDTTVKVNSEFTETSLSPNGKEFAYVFRGEIFVSSIEHGTTKRITNTPYQERSVSFSPDGKTLLYAGEVDNSWNVYKTSIVREDEAYFFLSTLLKQEPIIATAEEEFQPAFSPDGKEVAYLENRTTIKVINLESKNTRSILPANYNYSYSDGDMWYQWSPDSKWFLVTFGPKERMFWPEVGLIDASGTGTLRNLTQSGYEDYSPKWEMDGKMVIWGSTREGNRSENGFTAEGDVFGMFFTQKAFDKFNLSKEDFELLKEKEEEEKKNAKEEDDDDSKKKKAKKSDEDENALTPLIFDWDNLIDRKKKLTVHTSQASDYILSKEGDKLYYLTSFEGKNNLWVTDLRSQETKQFAKINGNNTSMELSKEGDFILVLSDGKPMKVDIKEGKVTPISTKGEMILKKGEERSYIFDHAWRQARDKFYVVDLQGVDWDYYKTAYEVFLPHINNSYDFTEMLSELLGELNASHTGSGYRHSPENGDQTSSLGVLYDYTHVGNGLKVAVVLKGGPLDKAASKVKAGNVIEKIDGQPLTTSIDFYQLLNRRAGDNVLISVLDPLTNTRWDEVVKPISLGVENQLLYQRWVDTRREETLKLSNGKLGYVHVRSMNDPSMRVVIEDALGKHISADALIVDTRFNGGGNLHDMLSDFLTGKKYMDIIPHGQNIGYQPGNRWIKPSIVIMGESNYSDAHLFPVAYKIKNGGKTLGMPVPGTGTFVWWETQIDPTIYFGIPMGGWRPIDEPFLENNQMEPDIKVQNMPGMLSAGRDQQLQEAVKSLLEN
ncbi:S41 family peptidase [uncultured Nonlabens sp.]|uniref:S41 family peptidase n=1 Tax=uncultured Nonlabens sp. TaxID=859306 RepID=UPI0030DAE928|tara:strand:+ start:2992 stop:6246 length:3255 start_codon:yes stop_codon:yes gene_type:complete